MYLVTIVFHIISLYCVILFCGGEWSVILGVLFVIGLLLILPLVLYVPFNVCSLKILF